MDLRKELRNVLSDRRRGASEIEERLLRELIGWLQETEDGRESVEALLLALTAGIRQHQPAMANLFELANQAWLQWEEVGGMAEETAEVKGRLGRSWRRRLDRLRERERDLGRHLVAWAEQRWGSRRPTLLTHSRSGTVRAGLMALREAGWDPIVMVGEGRPGNEGRDLARALRAPAGGSAVDARLVTDAAVVALAAGSSPGKLWSPDPERTAVVVGADAVGPDAFLNKVGTRALAVAARERGLPVLVLADAAKIVPETLFEALELPEAPEEELEAPAGVPALNLYFEVIPLELATRVVSEDGVAGPEEVRRLASGPVSPRLVSAIS